MKNKQHNWKVLLNSFRLNTDTVGFYHETQKLEPVVRNKK